MKKILIVIISVAICAGLGLTIPRLMGNSVEGVGVSEELLKQNFEMELQQLFEKNFLELQEGRQENEAEVISKGEMLMTTEHEGVALTEEVSLDQEVIKTEEGTQNTEDSNDDKSNIDESLEDKNEAQETEETKTTSSDELDIYETQSIPAGDELVKVEPIVGNKWVDQKIAENLDDISESDLSQGLALYSLLDTNYLFGLAEGGLTPEEKVEMQAYLSKTLTPSQVSAVMTLYSKYVHLLN